jgi:hypothetical protein
MADRIVYTETDIESAKLLPIFEAARAARDEDIPRFRDEGTCVLGAGIAIYYRAPRQRKPSIHVIVDAPFQGNVGSARACERALKLLRDGGIDAFWHDGRMD